MGKEQGIERGKSCFEGQPSLNSEMESRAGNRSPAVGGPVRVVR